MYTGGIYPIVPEGNGADGFSMESWNAATVFIPLSLVYSFLSPYLSRCTWETFSRSFFFSFSFWSGLATSKPSETSYTARVDCGEPPDLDRSAFTDSCFDGGLLASYYRHYCRVTLYKSETYWLNQTCSNLSLNLLAFSMTSFLV